jgi:SET domain-containing protein
MQVIEAIGERIRRKEEEKKEQHQNRRYLYGMR